MQNTALVVLNYKEVENTINVIETALSIAEISFIIVVDNKSSDGSYEKLIAYQSKKIKVIEANENGGYTKGYNIGLKAALELVPDGLIFVVNADIIYDSKLIQDCIEGHKNYPNFGLLTARMLGYDKKEQNAIWHLPEYYQYLRYCFFLLRKKYGLNIIYDHIDESKSVMDVDVIRGSFQCFKSEALKEIGLYDENIFLFNFENIVSLKLQQSGYRVGILTKSYYIHNHPPGKVNVMLRMKHCLKENYYYMCKYKNINIFKRVVLAVSSCYGYFEQLAIEKIRSGRS